MPPLDAKPLAGQRALVTGAARRLGREIALALARAGADVAVHYRDSKDEAEQTAADIHALGREAWLVQHSLDDAADAEHMFERGRQIAGPFDILVNNASSFPGGSICEATEADIMSSLHVNAMGPLGLSKAFALQGREGCIINMLDTSIVQYQRDRFAYHIAKRMLHTFTMACALEFAPALRVNAVAPGAVLAPEGKDDAYLEARGQETPLKRHGNAGMIADAVVYLCSATFVTGQVIFVDGGRHLYGGPYA